MSKWPMRGHFRYLRFKTFQMTSRTLQCKVFWALLSNSKHSGVPKDSKSPTLEVLGFTPTLGQSGVATLGPTFGFFEEFWGTSNFLYDFIIFSDLSTHLEKLTKNILKCKKYGINLNLEKFAFMVCSRTILRFVISKKGKTHNPQKIEALVKILVSKTPYDIQIFNGMAQFYICFISFLLLLWHQSPSYLEKV